MRKVHCDKCGIATNEFSFENMGTATIKINGPSFLDEQDEFHLCLDCTDELRSWLSEKKEVHE